MPEENVIQQKKSSAKKQELCTQPTRKVIHRVEYCAVITGVVRVREKYGSARTTRYHRASRTAPHLRQILRYTVRGYPGLKP
ncbi:hypothetical protein J6590_034743 [Homalodisca vitripennis]|nr:hypothetical protein J6590_034743 [Homalodisca vitripennis]